MTEITPPERTAEKVLCCCVLVAVEEEREPVPCNMETSGPDDPFCFECTDRHIDQVPVVEGHLEVTAKMRVREDT
jgi:hypothetical protein